MRSALVRPADGRVAEAGDHVGRERLAEPLDAGHRARVPEGLRAPDPLDDAAVDRRVAERGEGGRPDLAVPVSAVAVEAVREEEEAVELRPDVVEGPAPAALLREMAVELVEGDRAERLLAHL